MLFLLSRRMWRSESDQYAYGDWNISGLQYRQKGQKIMSYANINLEGRLVGAPEYKTGKEGKSYVTFTVAVNQHFGPQENASFFNC